MNHAFWNSNGDTLIDDEAPTPTRKLPPGHLRLDPPRYHTCHGGFHYSNPRSQGALIAATDGFPDGYDPTTHGHSIAYSDRMQSWDGAHYAEVCRRVGTGEQGWSSLAGWSDDALRDLVHFALKLPARPDHVRVVHHFNVSNGYSCPTLEAVYPRAVGAPWAAAPAPRAPSNTFVLAIQRATDIIQTAYAQPRRTPSRAAVAHAHRLLRQAHAAIRNILYLAHRDRGGRRYRYWNNVHADRIAHATRLLGPRHALFDLLAMDDDSSHE